MCVVWISGAALSADVAGDAGVESDGLLRESAILVDGSGTIVRIAVATADRIQIGASGSFRIVDPETGADVWSRSFRESVVVVADGGPSEPVPEVWRVQIGSFSDELTARAELRRWRSTLGVEGVVRYHPDRDAWRVRIGEASEREALSGLVSRVRDLGVSGAYLISEPSVEVEGVTLRLVDHRWDSLATEGDRLVVIPDPRSTLEADGKAYRGVLELRTTREGRVRAVNWLSAESYLRGVVPAELGPEVWPQLEALKAQAVAARTYLFANLGQFEEEHYDLCATPRCQVYGGKDAEHPLSDRAVRETRGEIVTYEGRPISALYTATCGGHTEDVENVFPEQSAPYLRGVPCRSEILTPDGGVFRLHGASLEPVISEIGEDVTRSVALLRVMGVLDTVDRSKLLVPLDGPSLRRHTTALTRAAGRPKPTGQAPAVADLASAARVLVTDLGWDERAYVVIEPEDVPAILRDEEALAFEDRDRRAVAALAAWGDLRPGADGRYGVGRPVSAARMAPVFARIAEGYRSAGLQEGTLRSIEGRKIRISRGAGEWTLVMAERPFLFSVNERTATVAESLDLWPGDRVRVRTDLQGRVDFLEVLGTLRGVSDDRSATVHSWTVRLERGELESAVARRLAVGDLEDLRVVRRGVSGRIAELLVVGSVGEARVRGFDVRKLLDLRENLTSMEVQRDAAGRLTGVVCAGRGWGHGVGLCQVGAYGMAIRGKNYEEILSHYYQGTRLGTAEETRR